MVEIRPDTTVWLIVWLIGSKDQKTNLKIGFLLQPQFESLETVDGSGTSKNIYMQDAFVTYNHNDAFFEQPINTGLPSMTSGRISMR